MCVFIIYRIDFSFVTFFGFLLWRWCPDCAYCEETILVMSLWGGVVDVCFLCFFCGG